MKDEEFLLKGISNISVNGQLFFSIKEIKQKFPDVKVNTEKIMKFTLNGMENQNLILSKDVEPMTDFDKKIMKSLIYKPKGKF